jgi:DNA mismatch repair ATPase MutS
MGGKSTLMRQVALIILLGQMGSPVPASAARWGVVSSLYTRIGAHDSIVRGKSTFMVEMSELAHILHHANERSLIVLDEIGRGTSTYDGISVAWSTLEWICNKIKARTLFATHYHELIHTNSGTAPQMKALEFMWLNWLDFQNRWWIELGKSFFSSKPKTEAILPTNSRSSLLPIQMA